MATNESGKPLYPERVKAPVMVHVTAPADLPAGYTFEAAVNGDESRTITVEVPEGGVRERQMFLAPIPDEFGGPHLEIPTGAWKDGLFGCCNAGVLHPHLWCALVCPQILMAQVMKRMSLTWLGEPGPIVSTKNTFKIVVTLVVCYVIYSTALEVASIPYDLQTIPPYIPVLRAIGSISFSVWALWSLCKTRMSTRAMYSIPEHPRLAGCEDCCCAFFCTCCTVAQIARHTGEYETYPGNCCTETGHPLGTPLVV